MPVLATASDISDIYWSTYQCDGYIYHFNTNKSEFKIYTQLDMKDKENGEYKSYQLTEGKIQAISDSLYSLTGKHLSGENTVDFTNMDQAVFKSTQYGQATLIQCNLSSAKELIAEAENHFKSCRKNVLNCKSR